VARPKGPEDRTRSAKPESGPGFHERFEKIAVRAKLNATITSSALDSAADPSGRVDTSSRPIRVENPDSTARRSNGQAEALVPCNRIGF
jgi:hypothetical protein